MIKLKKIISISAVIVLFDQIIKYFVSTLELHNKFTIIPNFFHITYVQNDGAAWSILSGSRFLLIAIAFIALFLLYFFLIRNKKLTTYEEVSYGLLVGGIIGNLVDRIIRGYVVDYLDFKIFNYYFPVFNLADIVIIVGMAVIIIDVLKGEKNEQNSSNRTGA